MPLIEIEGLDGSGKETQVALLIESLLGLGYDVKGIGYPVYDESAYLIQQHLGGAYGDDLNKLNPRAMSLYYTTNRVHDYLKNWKSNYESGDVVVADRYTGSNLIHQGCQMPNERSVKSYKRWLEEQEHKHCGLPKPDFVFFLDVPPDEQRKILKKRNKQKSGQSKDILEANIAYNEKCRNFVLDHVDEWGWIVIQRDNVDKVHAKILEHLLPRLVYEKEPEIKFGQK